MLQRMDHYIEEWQGADDHRQIFLACYRMMTERMMAAIEAGSFMDREWVLKLLNHFGDYYFNALECYDCGRTTPLVWQQVHQITREEKLHRLQYLILGVNAHINYDLVFTLYDMLEPEWASLSDVDRKIRYEDHCMVNEIIANTIDKVQDEILEPSDRIMALIDRLFGRLDEYLLSRLIRKWRREVWENTQLMLAATDPSQKEALRKSIEEEVMHRGRLFIAL
ncbi:MAG: hypothetical protein KDC34_08175 [Saprospiraceae bacterium]|nr:hypothetical protein [Saprospiraceae bacterium]